MSQAVVLNFLSNIMGRMFDDSGNFMLYMNVLYTDTTDSAKHFYNQPTVALPSSSPDTWEALIKQSIIDNGVANGFTDLTDDQVIIPAYGELSRLYRNGVLTISPKIVIGSGTVANGSVTFYLTDDGTANGNAVFKTVYMESLNLIIYSTTTQYQFSAPTVSADKKTLTITVGQLGTVILGIIQFVTAANGTLVYMQIQGDQ